ncbi:MAG: PqqD family protein [Candidatus Omnitrophica bacterium]|nr:PqqD family protein [Candidatus Omnitrophota bacterium]
MAGLKAEDVIRRSQRVVWETIDNEGVLLNLDNGNYFSLNEVGLDIWKEIEADASIDKIALAIAKKYTTTYKQVLPDVIHFMDILIKQGLVQVKG